MSIIDFLLNNITVTQTDKYVMFSGFRTRKFIKEIQRTMDTVRFTNGMLTHVTAMSFRVPLFFCYDFLNVLEASYENRTRYYNSKITKRVLDEFRKTPLVTRTTKEFPSRLNKKALEQFVFKPMESQSEFFDLYDKKTQQYALNGYILGAAPGLGKTISSLMLAFQLPEITKIVVLSPSNALYEVWEDTVANKIKGDVPYFVYGKGKPEKGKRVYIFSHDNLKFAKEVVNSFLKNENIFFIIDECHSFNEMKADRTNYLIEMCRQSKTNNVLFMSGTPFKAFGREVVPFLYCADPLFNEKAAEGFVKIFGVRGTLAMNILSSRIGRTLHIIEKKDVVQNEITNIELRVKVPNGVRFTMAAIRVQMEKFVKERVSYYNFHKKRLESDYLKIRADFGSYLVGEQLKQFERYCDTVEMIRHTGDISSITTEIKQVNDYERKVIIPNLSSENKKIFRDTTSVYKYVSLKIQGEALGRILGRERTLCNLEIIRHLEGARAYCEELEWQNEPFGIDDIFDMSESKVVFFTDYVEVLQEAETVLKKRGYHPKVVYGDTNKDLSDILKKFTEDPKVNPVIATIKSLSTAVPLIMADTIVFTNVPYRNYIYTQAVARVDRIGQKHPIKIFHVYLDTDGEPNISTRSKDLMEWSRQMVERLLGIKTGDSEDVEELLEEEFISSFTEGFSVKLKNLLGFK